MGRKARSLLASRVRALRLVHGWSQEELATACGVHRTYISLLERAACNASIDNLEKIADAFELSVPDLLGKPDAAFGEKLLAVLKSGESGED